MLTPTQAMDQASATAEEYARRGAEAYERIFGVRAAHDRVAGATFIAGFMQAASTDFMAWVIQNQIDGLSDTIEQTLYKEE